MYTPKTFTNRSARSYHLSSSSTTSSAVQRVHSQLPSYNPTPLIRLPNSKSLGVKNVFVKCETSRFGLPAFKILGASYAVFRALCSRHNLPHETTMLEDLKAADNSGITITAATDGNFGRATARMCALLGIPRCEIFVPKCMTAPTIQHIESESTPSTTVEVIVVKGDYDDAVTAASVRTSETGVIHIQDNAFPGYDTVPEWVSMGYCTMFSEVESQLPPGVKVDVVICPVGVGSLAHAVVEHYKQQERDTAVITVEPTTAACLNASLHKGEMVTVETEDTLMAGMNCGTVSTIAWPLLKEAVSVSLAIEDREAHRAVDELRRDGIDAGPCGAAALAGLRELMGDAKQEGRKAVGLGNDSTVLLICTEGMREYDAPALA